MKNGGHTRFIENPIRKTCNIKGKYALRQHVSQSRAVAESEAFPSLTYLAPGHQGADSGVHRVPICLLQRSNGFASANLRLRLL